MNIVIFEAQPSGGNRLLQIVAQQTGHDLALVTDSPDELRAYFNAPRPATLYFLDSGSGPENWGTALTHEINALGSSTDYVARIAGYEEFAADGAGFCLGIVHSGTSNYLGQIHQAISRAALLAGKSQRLVRLGGRDAVFSYSQIACVEIARSKLALTLADGSTRAFPPTLARLVDLTPTCGFLPISRTRYAALPQVKGIDQAQRKILLKSGKTCGYTAQFKQDQIERVLQQGYMVL